MQCQTAQSSDFTSNSLSFWQIPLSFLLLKKPESMKMFKNLWFDTSTRRPATTGIFCAFPFLETSLLKTWKLSFSAISAILAILPISAILTVSATLVLRSEIRGKTKILKIYHF